MALSLNKRNGSNKIRNILMIAAVNNKNNK